MLDSSSSRGRWDWASLCNEGPAKVSRSLIKTVLGEGSSVIGEKRHSRVHHIQACVGLCMLIKGTQSCFANDHASCTHTLCRARLTLLAASCCKPE
jgi:hypothetical protein